MALTGSVNQLRQADEVLTKNSGGGELRHADIQVPETNTKVHFHRVSQINPGRVVPEWSAPWRYYAYGRECCD